MAEGTDGQFDGIVYPDESFGGLDGYSNDKGRFLNFTHVQEITNSKYNLSPRKQFCGAKVGTDYTTLQAKYDT